MTWDEHIAELCQQELNNPPGVYYLSFAGDEGFRGAAMVEAFGATTAIINCHLLGINPGGEVAVMKCPKPVLPELMNRLLSREELADAFGPLAQIPRVQND